MLGSAGSPLSTWSERTQTMVKKPFIDGSAFEISFWSKHIN